FRIIQWSAGFSRHNGPKAQPAELGLLQVHGQDSNIESDYGPPCLYPRCRTKQEDEIKTFQAAAPDLRQSNDSPCSGVSRCTFSKNLCRCCWPPERSSYGCAFRKAGRFCSAREAT